MAENLSHGFAAMNGGTSGGSGGKFVTVTTGAQLQAAINSASGPLTIQVSGKITPANSGVADITLSNRHDISIIGTGAGADFSGIGFRVTNGSSNLIFQNLKIHDVSSGSKDAIGIELNSHNIWIDHNELYSSSISASDSFDGLLDIKRGAEYITVSNNYFHDHHKTSLAGYSDSDAGSRYLTYDHNLFEDIGSRAPSVRDGYVHIYDNYYTGVTVSAINLRMGAKGLIENNVFEDSKNPIVSFDSPEKGFWELHGNIMQNVSWSTPGSGEATAQDGRSTTTYKVPYTYSLDSAASVKALVMSEAGAGYLADAGSQTDPLPQPSSPTTTPLEPATSDTGESSSPAPISQVPGEITGTAAADRIVGQSGNETFHVLGGNDYVWGQGGNDVLFGGDGIDYLYGGNGDDQLSGGAGADVLNGGIGADQFIFDTALSSAGADRIVDFNIAADTIVLNKAVFSALALGTLADSAFTIGTAAHDSGDRVIYNRSNGTLWYDADGTGSTDAVMFAHMQAGLIPTHNDFLIV